MVEDETILVREELLELLTKEKLNNSQKTKIMDLIDKDDTATENEKERFMLYYGLNINGRKPLRFKQIAKLYGCSDSAIRNSVYSMKRKLLKYTDTKDNLIVKNIINECRMEMNNSGEKNKGSSC